MRGKKRILITAMAGVLPLLTMGAGIARADTVTPISGLSGFHQMVVDTSVSPGYIFMAGTGNDSIVVTDLSGKNVAVLDPGDGVKGIALSSDGSTLYAALTAGANMDSIAAISVSTVTAATPTQTFVPLAAGDVPYSLAVEGGKLWVSYNDGAATDPGAIGDVDLTVNVGTFEPASAASSLPAPPDLATDPLAEAASATGVLVAVQPGITQTAAATYSITNGQAAPLAPQASLGSCSDENQIAVQPGGQDFLAACTSPQNVTEYTTNDLSQADVFASGASAPAGAAVDADGSVAVGTAGSPSAIYVYKSGSTALTNIFTVANASSLVPANGLAWEDTTTGPQLAALVLAQDGTYSLDVFDQPTVTDSALTLSAPATAAGGTPIALTGSLTLSTDGALPANTTVTVTRTGGSAGSKTFPPVTPGAGGSFLLSDTPPATGTYTYTATYAGVQNVTASATATATVKVALNSSRLSLKGPSSAGAGKRLRLTGTLAFGAGTVAKGTKLTVTRTVAGSKASKQFKVFTRAGGAFTLTDTPTPAGAYTYTATYAGDAVTAAATASHRVSVVRSQERLTLTTGGVDFPYKAVIHVTAHLGATYKNRTVSIYAQWIGTKARKLLKRGTVNSRGDLTVTFASPRSTLFTAVFGGDAAYLPRTVTRAAFVQAGVSETISGYFASKHIHGVLYRIFHSSAVLQAAASVAPNKRGECVQFVVEERFQGAWRFNVKTPCLTLSKSSRASQAFGLSQADLGFPYRIQAEYVRKRTDRTNLSAASEWLYLMVQT